MSNFLRPLPDAERRARYRVTLANRPAPHKEGLAYESGGGRGLLPWSTITHVIAAEVGEPEGVRTIVFDLLCPEGGSWRVLRLDAEPGEEAIQLAKAIQEYARPDQPCASLKSVATDGLPTRWFPDLASFEEAALSDMR